MVIFEIYIMSWLNGFEDSESGPIYTDDQKTLLYQYQGIAGCLGSFILLYFVGTITDKISSKITLPLSFLIRGGVFFSAYFVNNPNGWMFHVVTPLMYVCQYSVVIILMSYLNKMYPKDIRGMMTSVQGLISKLGQLIYIQISLYLYHRGFNLPFLGVAVLDLITSLAIIFGVCFFDFGDIIDERELRLLHGYIVGNDKFEHVNKRND